MASQIGVWRLLEPRQFDEADREVSTPRCRAIALPFVVAGAHGRIRPAAAADPAPLDYLLGEITRTAMAICQSPPPSDPAVKLACCWLGKG